MLGPSSRSVIAIVGEMPAAAHHVICMNHAVCVTTAAQPSRMMRRLAPQGRDGQGGTMSGSHHEVSTTGHPGEIEPI